MGDSGGSLTRVNNDGETVLLGNVCWGHGRCDMKGYTAIQEMLNLMSINELGTMKNLDMK